VARPFIIGNWKTYISSLKAATALLKNIEKGLPRQMKAEVIVCPPSPFIAPLRERYSGKRIAFGAQDVSYDDGAPTGDVRAEVLTEVGATHVIIGHAERRRDGDTDEIVSKKLAAALEARLTPIVCFGEKVRDREGAYLSELEASITASLAGISEPLLKKVIIAYEPVWAIGAAEPPSPREIREIIIFIRKVIASRFSRELALKATIIYGGAVNEANVRELIEGSGAGGFLLGRASIEAGAFTEIVRACL
jgi:triosephosphate isomerase